jgi:acetolactate synthase regulatory subunit
MPSTHAAERSAPSTFRFSLRARSEPGVMPRVLELFAKRGLVPRKWHSVTFGPDGAALKIDLEIAGIEPVSVDYVANCMRGIVGVETVLTADA